MQRIVEQVELAITAVRLEAKAKELSSSGMKGEAAALWQQSEAKAKAAGDQYSLVKHFLERGGRYVHPALWSVSIH
jgi:hypothetical protein